MDIQNIKGYFLQIGYRQSFHSNPSWLLGSPCELFLTLFWYQIPMDNYWLPTPSIETPNEEKILSASKSKRNRFESHLLSDKLLKIVRDCKCSKYSHTALHFDFKQFQTSQLGDEKEASSKDDNRKNRSCLIPSVNHRAFHIRDNSTWVLNFRCGFMFR